MTKQTLTGKAFEYSLLHALFVTLKSRTPVSILENDPFFNAKRCYDSFSEDERLVYFSIAVEAINSLIEMEPLLINSVDENDFLQLEIVSDKEGQGGDVRDVLMIRSSKKWEIGISAKNNHRAVKHSRLSQKIDFGEKWLGVPCSEIYFNEIRPIFSMLAARKKEDKGAKWNSITDMHDTVYVPILVAFKKELLRIVNEDETGLVASRLVEYLVGNHDFYKIIKGKQKFEIQVFNLHGTLGQTCGEVKPLLKNHRIKFPTRVVEIDFEHNSKTTLIVNLNEGWQISFRIHNASSRIEPSLKFDINLISVPHTLFTTHVFVGDRKLHDHLNRGYS